MNIYIQIKKILIYKIKNLYLRKQYNDSHYIQKYLNVVSLIK